MTMTTPDINSPEAVHNLVRKRYAEVIARKRHAVRCRLQLIHVRLVGGLAIRRIP